MGYVAHRAANVFLEEPDAVVPHVRIWGEGAGVIRSLTRHQTALRGPQVK